MRLGDLDELKKQFDNIPFFIGLTGNCVQEMIDDMPIVEAVPVVHGKWIEQHFGTLIPVEYDDTGNAIVHDCINYQCSLCGRTESKKEPYCNCGAKMDGE